MKCNCTCNETSGRRRRKPTRNKPKKIRYHKNRAKNERITRRKQGKETKREYFKRLVGK